VDFGFAYHFLNINCMKTYPRKWTRVAMVSTLSACVVSLTVAVSPAHIHGETRTAPPEIPEGWTASVQEKTGADEGVQTRSGANQFFCQYVDPFYCD